MYYKLILLTSISLSLVEGAFANPLPKSSRAAKVFAKVKPSTLAAKIESSPIKWKYGKAEMRMIKNEEGQMVVYQAIENQEGNSHIFRETDLPMKSEADSAWKFIETYDYPGDGSGFKVIETHPDKARMGQNQIATVKSFLVNDANGILRTQRLKKSREPSGEYISIGDSQTGKPPFYMSIHAKLLDIDNVNAVTLTRKPRRYNLIDGIFTLEPKFTSKDEVLVDMQITDHLDRVILITNKGRAYTYHMPKAKDEMPNTGLLKEYVVTDKAHFVKFQEAVVHNIEADANAAAAVVESINSTTGLGFDAINAMTAVEAAK